MSIKFAPPSPEFLQKHGRLYCECCKKNGDKVEAALMPAGYPKSILFKREFATCDDHLEETLIAAERRIELDRQDLERDAYLPPGRYFR